MLHPASTAHRQVPEEQRNAAGAGPDVIRDLDQALVASGVG